MKRVQGVRLVTVLTTWLRQGDPIYTGPLFRRSFRTTHVRGGHYGVFQVYDIHGAPVPLRTPKRSFE